MFLKSILFVSFVMQIVLGFTINCKAEEEESKKLSANATLIKQNPNLAFTNIKHLLKEAQKDGNNYAAAVCYEQIGELFYDQSAYSQALINYYKSDILYRKGNFLKEIARNTNKIGATYFYNKQYDKALETFQKALLIYKKLNNRLGIAESYGFIGQAYEKSAEPEKAFSYQKMALKEFSKSEQQTGIAKIYENLGSLYEDKFRLDSALHYFEIALEINKKENNNFAQIEIINNIGDVYRKSGKYVEALIYTRKAESLANALNEKYQLASAYRDLAKAYNLKNQNDSAYFYSEAGRKIYIDIFSNDNKKQLLLLQTLFETEQKDNAISQFENDQKNKNIIIFSGLGFTILLVILGYIIISKQRLKNKIQKELDENKHQVYEANLELMNAEISNKALKEENLHQELELKSKQLNSHILHLIQKNQLLQSLRSQITEMVKDDKRDQKRQMQQLVNQIAQDFNNDQHWTEFLQVFELVHHTFFEKLKSNYPELTDYDLRLLALMKMNLASKDISLILAISVDSLRISRYRTKKKLNLPAEESLSTFIHTV